MEPGVERVGWIGTGVMGSSMCGHLLAAGFGGIEANRIGNDVNQNMEARLGP